MSVKNKAQTPSANIFGRASNGVIEQWQTKLKIGPIIEWVKQPYVAPVGVGVIFVGALSLFLIFANDPNAGAPSTRVAMSKLEDKAKASHGELAQVSGMQAFTIDSLGLFQEAGPESFDQGTGEAVITMPDQITDVSDAGLKAANTTKLVPSTALPTAPIAGLLQTGPEGNLPVIGPNGITPASAYAAPFKSDGRPMIALIVGGLGINPTQTKAAIEQLPGAVTLSFAPYSQGLQTWIDMARAHGHEVIIEVPMQPSNYPENDPGPQTLMANARSEDLTRRLKLGLIAGNGLFCREQLPRKRLFTR